MTRRGQAKRLRAGADAAELRRKAPAREPTQDVIETMITRARKHRSKGDTRRAIVILREACAIDERRARTWAIFGALLLHEGRDGDAQQALRQARWLRLREGDRGRAAAIDRLIARGVPTAA